MKSTYQAVVQVRACWEGVVAQAQVEEREKAIDAFNKENRWRKRGLAILPTMFGDRSQAPLE